MQGILSKKVAQRWTFAPKQCSSIQQGTVLTSQIHASTHSWHSRLLCNVNIFLLFTLRKTQQNTVIVTSQTCKIFSHIISCSAAFWHPINLYIHGSVSQTLTQACFWSECSLRVSLYFKQTTPGMQRWDSKQILRRRRDPKCGPIYPHLYDSLHGDFKDTQKTRVLGGRLWRLWDEARRLWWQTFDPAFESGLQINSFYLFIYLWDITLFCL